MMITSSLFVKKKKRMAGKSPGISITFRSELKIDLKQLLNNKNSTFYIVNFIQTI